MTVTLVHSSDIHVEDDVTGLGHTGLPGLRAVIDTARAVAADVLLLAGDTFDNHRVSAPVLNAAVGLIGGAGLPVVLLPGNHDPVLPDCMFRRSGLADMAHVRIFGVTHNDRIVLEKHGLEILGRAHRGFGDMAPLPAPRPRVAHWQVVAAHGHYVPPHDWQAQSHRAWRIGDDDLAAMQVDYIALGHWDRAVPAGDGRVPAFYSGSPDLAQSVNLVRLDETDGVSVTRQFLQSQQQR